MPTPVIGLFLVVFCMIMVPAPVLAVPADRTITWIGGGQGMVTFEGKEHAEEGYTCDACHPALFQMKKGTAVMTMEALNRGAFCGHCHNGAAAFSTTDRKKCDKCHATKRKHHENHDHHDKHHD